MKYRLEKRAREREREMKYSTNNTARASGAIAES